MCASTASATEERLHELALGPSASRIENDIRTLVGFGTRHTLSETESETRGIGAARRWIKSEFDRISADCGGCLEVYFQGEVVSGLKRIPDPVEVVSVIAIKRGASDPNRYLVMAGDIDSRVSDPMDSTSDSPGANDNASGMAGAIEAARVLSQHEFAASIVFAGLAGEEQGLVGGEILAKQAVKDGWQIEAVLNNDMIGNISGINGVTDNGTARIFSEGTRATETPEQARLRRYRGGEVDSPSRNLARFIDQVADKYIANLDTMMVYRLDRFGRGGHHRPFNEAGFPGVRIMETNEHYDRQHQDIRTEHGTDYGDASRLIFVVGFDRQLNCRTGCAAHQGDRIFEFHTLGVLVGDLHDQIAGAQSFFVCGRIQHGTEHDQTIGSGVNSHFDTDAAKDLVQILFER